jgi:hypothetical protein
MAFSATYTNSTKTIQVNGVKEGNPLVPNNKLIYATISGFPSTITWDTGSGGTAPTTPSEIYVFGYIPDGVDGKVYQDVWSFVLNPNGVWTLYGLNALLSDTHATNYYMVGYDTVNQITYTQTGTFTLSA